MQTTCPACGKPYRPPEGDHPWELEYEDEIYKGPDGAEMKLTIPFCNDGPGGNRVVAANRMDLIAEAFFDAVGRNE